MSGLSVSGIASGIDSDSIISQMVAFETRSLTNLQRRIAIEEAERVTFQDLNGRLQELQSATNAFASDSLFSQLSTTSSDTSILTASATDAAPRGSHTVKVLQRALAHRLGGTGVEDSTATPLIENFSKTSYADALLGSLNSDSTLSTVADSTYDYENSVSIDGTYTGTDNVDITIELVSDYNEDDGTIDVRISTDGGQTFSTENVNVTVGGAGANDDTVTLTSADHLNGVGFDITLNNLDGLKDNDEFSFRARGTATLEYTVGDGTRKEILMDSETTLTELVNQINDSSDNGLRADILNDGSSTNPFRLILTSLTEGSDGAVEILHNSSIVGLTGFDTETPVLDSTSYSGDVTVNGAYDGSLGNTSIVIEIIDDGLAGTGDANTNAYFRISVDGGLTFHDNGDDGFEMSANLDLSTLKDDDGNDLFATGFTVDFDAGNLTTGDLIKVDVFSSEIQSAQDALININGINLIKSSNVVDDVFEGLTLNLQDADPDKTVTINISEKAGDISSAVGSFVSAYNSVMGLLDSQSAFDPEEDTSAPLLMGDSTLRQIQGSLQRYVTGRISILNGDTLSALSDIGISSDSKTGQLSFNSSDLSSALSSDPTAVRRLLSRFGDLIEGSNASFVSSTSATQAGSYEVEVVTARTRAEVVGLADIQTLTADEDLTIRVNSDAQGNGNVTSMVVNLTQDMTDTDQVNAIQTVLDTKGVAATAAIENNRLVIRSSTYGEDISISIKSSRANGDTGFTDAETEGEGTNLSRKINGLTVTSDGDVLVGSSGFAFEGLRIRVSNDFSGVAGTIRVNDGLGSSFSKILDSFISTDGILSTKIGSFDSAITRLESQITRVNERASLLEERLRKQFVNLEVTLGRLNAQGDFLTAQLKTLPGVNNKK